MEIVREPERAVGPDGDPVRPSEHAFSPRSEEVPLAVEHDDRVLASVEDVDVVLGVDGDARRLDERPPLGKPSPPLDRPVVHARDLLGRRLYCHNA